jgi:hypothetical protein
LEFFSSLLYQPSLFSIVMRGLDPRIHRKKPFLVMMDCRVKPVAMTGVSPLQQALVLMPERESHGGNGVIPGISSIKSKLAERHASASVGK